MATYSGVVSIVSSEEISTGDSFGDGLEVSKLVQSTTHPTLSGKQTFPLNP